MRSIDWRRHPVGRCSDDEPDHDNEPDHEGELSLEAELVALHWHRLQNSVTHAWASDSDADYARTVRDACEHHGRLRDTVTDAMLIEAAADAYGRRVDLIRRYREKKHRDT